MGAKKRAHDAHPKSPLQIKDNAFNDKADNSEADEMPEYSKMSHIEDGEGLSDYPVHQQHEYVLVNSMYSGMSDKFERIHGKRSPWKQFDNLAFAFNVASLYNFDFTARLEFEFPRDYPKVPLIAKLLALKPRQDDDLEDLINEALNNIPKRRQDSETLQMEGVMAIVEPVLQYLNDAAAKMEARLEGKSLAETRDEDKALRRYHALAERNRRKAEQEAELIAEDERLKKSYRLEKQRRHNPESSEMSEEEDPNAKREVAEIMFRFSKKINTINPETGEKFSFFAVCGATVVHKDNNKRVVLVHPLKFGRIHMYQFVLKQIYIPVNLAAKDNMQKSMDEIRMTLDDCKNSDNPNLVKVYAFNVDLDEEVPEMPEYRISILTEFATAGSILQAMRISGGFRAIFVRKYANELLLALDHIEKLGHVHPGLHTRNLLVFDDPKGGYRIKLSDCYGATLLYKMQEARLRISRESSAQVINGWTPPEIAIDPMTRSIKTCVWELAMVVINMGFLEGWSLEQVLTSPEKLKYRDDLDEAFKDFIQKAFQATPYNRPSLAELMSHKFFKDGGKDINIPTPENPGPVPHLLRSGFGPERGSLWAKKFEKSGNLGSGSFGEVAKVRNVDDGQYYAVKTIKCATAQDLKNIWNEVRLLATLNHPGVVRYYNAWNEDILTDDQYVENMRAATREAEAPSDPTTEGEEDPDPFSIGHDFMDPSLPRRIGPEYDSSDDDSNPFAYQSPPRSTDEDETQSRDAVDSGGVDDWDAQPRGIDNDSDGHQVLFEDERAPERQDSIDPVPAALVAPERAQRRPSGPREVILYIQMELCETATLSTVIKGGLPYRVSEVWRLFRQILEALQHIHEKGIVHRDLKPSNIFIDSNKHVKIGDFGLATSGRSTRTVKTVSQVIPTFKAGRSSRGVGTTYYVAPELESAGSGNYSTKADMFSLGVVFFQMCYPSNTEQERLNHLSDISAHVDYKLPAFFDDDKYQQQRKIISELISHNQDERPSATALLESGDLPEIIDSSILGRYITRIKTENPVQYLTLMEDIFERSLQFGRAEELAYLSNSTSGAMLRMDPQVVQLVDDQMVAIFRRQGAVPSTRGMPVPRRSFYPTPAVFIDDMGMQIQLPCDLTLPFAVMLADPVEHLLADPDELPPYTKYYCIGLVFRKAARKGAQPNQLPEFDYDEISFSAKNISLKDAEVIKVLDEVLLEMPALQHRTVIIYLNHGDLLDLILEFCKIPVDRWDRVKRELSYLHVSNTGWSDVRHRLLTPALRITETCLSLLAELRPDGDFDQIRQQINKVFDQEYRNRALRPLTRLEETMNYIKMLGVTTTVHISLLSNQSEPLYRGSIMFQCVLVRAKLIFAVGGRYDKLVEYYEQPEKKVKGLTRAAGFRINGQILYDYSHTHYGKRRNPKSKALKEAVSLLPRRIDVVVTSFDETTLIGPCVEIVKDLKMAGVKVERSEHYNTMEELDQRYGQTADFWLVIVRPGPSSKRSIKVRTPSREEIEVRPSELVAYLKGELGDKSTTEQPKLKKQPSSYGDSSSVVRIVIPKHKSKKVNRMSISDAATAAATKIAEEIGTSAPVVAFAPSSEDIFQSIRNTRLTDSETWKTLKQMAPLVERSYLQDVQQELEELAGMGREGAFLVNYLTNSCIYYDFGKRS